MVLYVLTGYRVLGIVYLDQLMVACHQICLSYTHILSRQQLRLSLLPLALSANDVMSVRHCLTSFRIKNNCILLICSVCFTHSAAYYSPKVLFSFHWSYKLASSIPRWKCRLGIWRFCTVWIQTKFLSWPWLTGIRTKLQSDDRSATYTQMILRSSSIFFGNFITLIL